MLIQVKTDFSNVIASSPVKTLLDLHINNCLIDEIMRCQGFFSIFSELLGPRSLALCWVDVSILVESNFFINSFSCTYKCE